MVKINDFVIEGYRFPLWWTIQLTEIALRLNYPYLQSSYFQESASGKGENVMGPVSYYIQSVDAVCGAMAHHAFL